MWQLANTPAVVVPDRDGALARAPGEKVKKATELTSAAYVGKTSGAAYAGKTISAFENEKMVLSARADSRLARQCPQDSLPAGMETSFVGYKWALCFRACMSANVSHERTSARFSQAEVAHLFIDYHPVGAAR
jgi:hypothetical protein